MPKPMKKIINALALACVLISACSRNLSPGERKAIALMEQDDKEYSLFAYKDEDGSFGYYLSFGDMFPTPISEAFSRHSSSLPDETCLVLGANRDEVLATVESLLAQLEQEPGTTGSFPCRLATESGRLSGLDTVNYVVVKSFPSVKILRFQLVCGERTAEANLTGYLLKGIRRNINWQHRIGRAE